MTRNHKEMAMRAQVGDLKMDDAGIACSGLLVRHLVMPGRLEDTRRILEFLKTSVSAGPRQNQWLLVSRVLT